MATNWLDRVPTYPGRWKITKSNGTYEYVTMERADEPTVEGTPINAENLNALEQTASTAKATADNHVTNTSNPHGVTASQVGLGNVTNNKQMPIAGGTFTGNAVAYETARTTRGLFNEETRKSNEKTGTLQSVKYFINVID